MKLETLHKWKEGATIFALIAVPIIVAFGPAILQNRTAKESVHKDYVTLAIGLLSKKKEDRSDNEIRLWAVEVLSKNSPVPIPENVKEQLQAGAVSLPGEQVQYNVVGGGNASETGATAVEQGAKSPIR